MLIGKHFSSPEADGQGNVIVSGCARFLAAHTSILAPPNVFPTAFVPIRRIWPNRLLVLLLGLADAIPMKYCDSVRNTVEICLRPGVKGVQIARELKVKPTMGWVAGKV